MTVSLHIATDAFNMLCGRKLGSGVYRDVFECKIDKSLVVKVEIENENGYRTFNNVKEMEFWQYYCDIAIVKKWLAPCTHLSADGHLLLQKRIDPIRPQERAGLPAKIPAFLTDTKYDNFGWLDGRLVCCDYASVVMNPSIAMRKADWWGDE